MIKALFFDLDDTLLNSEKKIPDSAVRAIQKCRAKGISVFPATARSDRLERMLGWTKETYALFSGGIYCNGGCNHIGDRVEYAYLPAEAVRTCVETVKDFPGVHLSLHMQGDLHAFNYTLPKEMYGPWGVTEKDILPLREDLYSGVVKILIFTHDLVNDADPLPEELFRQLKASCGDTVKLYLSDRGKTVQAVSREVGKYSAIEKLRIRFGLQKDEIAVFGDDVNDIEMLQAYRNSVAMGNAVPEVKKIAEYVTKANDEDGIAYALEKVLGLL